MTWILLAEKEANTFRRIRAVLVSHGWFLRTVTSRDQALEVARQEPPLLVLVDEDLPGAQELVQAFASSAGGPGVIVVGQKPGSQAEPSDLWRGDDFLSRSFSPGELVELVRRQLGPARAAPGSLASPAQGRKFTTKEIFGDLLDDVLEPGEMDSGSVREQPPASPPPPRAQPPEAPQPRPVPAEKTKPSPPESSSSSSLGIDSDVDETLSGVLAETHPGVDGPFLGAADPSRADKEVDELLTRTLADLDIGDVSGAARALSVAPAGQVQSEHPSEETGEPTEIPAVVTATPRPTEQPRVGEYLLEERIGVGGMAEVWMARRLGVEGFEKRVAIKKILSDPADNQAFIDMFIDEAKLAAQLTHNNITHIYELGRSGSDYFIAMEYVEGADLRKVLNAARKQGRTIPPALALLVAAKIATALDYAHRRKDLNDRLLGLVHRDVSPRNVLISHEGVVKLCDFGVAKAASKVAKTQQGALKGKLPYMSPEQAWGKAVDARSDIFSTATLLFEMLTGERLFDGESELGILEAVRDCEIGPRLDRYPEIPLALRAVLLKALAKDPPERYQAAGELKDELEGLLRRVDSKAGETQLAVFIQEILQPQEEAEGESVPAPELTPLEEKTRPVETDGSEEPAHEDLEATPSTADDSNEETGSGRQWTPWAFTVAFLIVAFGGVAWWTFRPLQDSPAGDSGVEPAAATERRIRLPFQSGGAFHATERSRAPEAAPPEVRNDSLPPQTETMVITSAPALPASEPTPQPPTFDGDAELQRQFEAELRRVEELLAASPLNGSDPGSSSAPTAEPEATVEAQEEPVAEETGIDAPAQQLPDPQAIDDLSALSVDDSARPGRAPAEAQATGIISGASLPPLPSPAAGKLSTSAAGTQAADPEPTDSPLDQPDVDLQVSALTPAVEPGELVEPGPGVVPPAPLALVRPSYPPLASKLGVEGTVRMSLLVDETGQVIETRLLEGVTRKVGLNEAALDAASKAKFRPATKDGVPVKMWFELVSRFEQ